MILKRLALFTLAIFTALLTGISSPAQAADRPNILFVIGDDLSARYCSPYGDKMAHTPAMARLAREGVKFTRAFTAVPSCTPSRSAILTGQAIYRLRQAGQLMGEFPPDLSVYPEKLQEAGYHIGYTGKGWAPGNWRSLGRKTDPVGRAFNEIKNKRNLKLGGDPLPDYAAIDYAGNFDQFLKQRPAGKPFYFWVGTIEPHLAWPKEAGIKQGKKLQDAVVPPFLPDTETIRSDLLDQAAEIEHLDQQLMRMIQTLEASGDLDKTMIIFTSDHGTPLPRAKCNLYDAGTHVPFIVRYPAWSQGGRTVDDIISLPDVAPTILEAAQLPGMKDMTGRSLAPLLKSKKSGWIDRSRDFAVMALERHTWCRPDGVGYPMRALRTDRYLYIRNFEPSRWPAGDPDFEAFPQGVCGDADAGETKTFLIKNRDNPGVSRYWHLAFGQRPAEELYDVKADPDQLKNLAGSREHAKTLAQMKSRLEKYLAETGDPRSQGEAPWDAYPYHFKKSK